MKKRLLIKIGGRAFESRDGFRELARAIQQADTEVIIVHGGGSEISRALQDAKRETVFLDGIRITQAEDVAIVERVLSETINTRIAEYLTEWGVDCERMSGKTEQMFVIEKMTRNGKNIGFVGRVVAVRPEPVLRALNANRVPVVSPISADSTGQSYNVNADTAAAALAKGAACTDLVYISDVPGVKSGDMILQSLRISQAQTLIDEGVIQGGMVAKMESSFVAIRGGVQRVHVTQWQGPDTLLDLLQDKSITKTTLHE